MVSISARLISQSDVDVFYPNIAYFQGLYLLNRTMGDYATFCHGIMGYSHTLARGLSVFPRPSGRLDATRGLAA